MTLKRLFYKLTVAVPNQELNWNLRDFEKGKKWAKSLDNPHKKNSDLWVFLKNKDSVEILDYLNKRIRALNADV